MIYFLHVPKTSGQSFRQGAVDYFGKNKCILLYGEDKKTTSTIANSIYYKAHHLSLKEKYVELCLYIKKHNILFYSSHASATALPCFDPNQAAIFLREPLSRLISHYNYAIKKKHIKGSFESFIENPIYQNMQSALLGNQVLSSIGFVGLTEKYKESLYLFNAHFGTNLKFYQKNKMFFLFKKIKKNNLDASLIKTIKQLNQKDFELYEEGEPLFNKRLEAFKNV